MNNEGDMAHFIQVDRWWKGWRPSFFEASLRSDAFIGCFDKWYHFNQDFMVSKMVLTNLTGTNSYCAMGVYTEAHIQHHSCGLCDLKG